MVMTGVVKNITDYGCFVDLGGIDGLLHITDMSWGRINHPSEMFEVGQEVEVMVLKFDPDSRARQPRPQADLRGPVEPR
jgi:small subunit ribosomal protein S1